MAASFLPCPGEKATRKHPFFEGLHVTSRRGRSMGKLPTHAVFVFPHPAPLCFSWPGLSPGICWLTRLGLEVSRNHQTDYLHSNPKCCPQDVVQCGLVTAIAIDLPCVLLVLFPRQLFFHWEAMTLPEKAIIPTTWGHGPKFCVQSPGPNELDDRCCKYQGVWCKDVCHCTYMWWFPWGLTPLNGCKL